MTAREKTGKVLTKLYHVAKGPNMPHFEDAETLRRAEMTLHRWAELECGDSNRYGAWCITRDDNGKPFMETHSYHRDSNTTRLVPIADREAGALKRIAAVCERLGLYYYHQTDPRGCQLYVSSKPLDRSNYTNGVAITA